MGDALPPVLHAKLAAAGLVAARGSWLLGPWVDGYIAGRTDVKPGTATVLGMTRRNLVEFFGADRPLASITPGDADDWRRHLIGEGLADNTVRRRCGIAKQFFRAAIRKRLLADNPFADLKAVVQSNPAKAFFVTRAMTDAVLAACPDAQWRLIVALSRYGGLRCPSEHLALRWADVLWDKDRMHVQSPKTEHHEGGESRMVPIFPELLPYLRDAFDLAEPGAEHVITRYRDPGQNLRTTFIKIIKRAGLVPWPKLFHNLRATRETELAETWPEHIVTKWIGHTTAVARKHYLQVTEDHFERAATASVPRDGKAAQNPAQKVSEDAGKSRKAHPAESTDPLHLPALTETFRHLPNTELSLLGLEPRTHGLKVRCSTN
jgi:integrase